MIKDMIKTLDAVLDDENLNNTEKVLMMKLMLNYNVNLGYAFPGVDILMKTIGTSRPNTFYPYLDKLKAKGYITIGKGKDTNSSKGDGRNNVYYINQHLHFVGEQPAGAIAVDSDGKKPLENQLHIDEVIATEEIEVVEKTENTNVIEITDYTGFTVKQSALLLKASGENKAIVINAFDYMKKKPEVKGKFNYTMWVINNQDKTLKVETSNLNKGKTVSKFNNFEPRNYNYTELENKLLGWQEQEQEEAEEEPNQDILKLLKSM